LKLNIKARINE